MNAAEEGDATGLAGSGGAATKKPTWAAQSNQLSAALARNYILRIDTPFGTRTVSVPLFANASEIRSIIARKSVSATGAVAYRLFVRDKGSERPLGESEKPALLQRRRMEQAGYTEADGLETLGREDHSYLLKFVYRPDSVPNFDSESFGNTEDRFSHLDLSNRNIEMVPIFVYRHADWISFLDLSANPMSDLPTDFIQLCSNLRTLRLSALTLKRVPQSIRNSETLTHLDLSNNRIPELTHIALDQVPQLRSLKIQNNRLAELPPYFSRMKALKQLNISNNRFDAFPSVICNLSALSDLDISFNSIPSLDPGIGDLKQLESLILVGNSVESLPEAISGLSSLRKIDLRRNGVQDVSALFRLETLSEAHCEHNSIKALDAVLAGNLRSITLGHNPLSKMTIATSARSHLVKLDLSAANLSRLDDDLVGHLRALRDLNLDDNQFLSLPDTLGQLTELQVLKCTNNHLASLPESIGSLSNLKWLLVHNNNLKSLPSSIWQCGKLDTINASSNLLESFPLPPMSTESRGSDPTSKQADAPTASAVSHTSAALMDPAASRKGSVSSLSAAANAPSGRKLPPLVSALKKLRLADNRLTHDVLDVLGFFVEVEVLNLSFNEIYEVPQMSLAKLTKLRELYLSGNSLTSVPTDDLVYMKRLRILHINANRLLTLPAELGQLTDLANLDVGNNTLKYNISNWQFDWNWNSNPGLRYLNLSGNKRLEIKTKMTGVTGGRKTDASDFQRLLNLRVLSLIDVTVLLQAMPEENDNRRVRTSLSQINNMSYGMSDALGRFDNLNVVDVVIPQFRGDSRQCVFGLFEGRGHSLQSGSRIAKFLSDWVKSRIEREMAEALAHKEEEGAGDDIRLPDRDQVTDILRRAFLRLQQEYALLLMAETTRKATEAKAAASANESKASAPAIAASTAKAQWQAGAAGVILYIADRTLYCANVGDALAVLSRGGTAQSISTRHNPLDRAGTERIRASEGWVSLRGYVNDMLDVSRSFGYFHLNPILTAAPMVACVELDDADEFVIVASRALWEHMSFQTAVDIARTERGDLMIAAQKLRDFAISYGAEESIMVMIVGVGDLFQNRTTPGGTLDTSMDYFRKAHNRRERGANLVGDRTLARLEREVAPPVGQVALVFTDIKNSTSLWETNGGMHSAMRLHNVLLRRQLRSVGGYEVKTEGDAFMVSFPTVTSALLWCFNCQLALLREDWPQEILESEDGKEILDASGDVIYRGLSVRMGVHWGRPVCEADPITRRMDYFGPMVNRSARVSGAADGGQIMASKDFIHELTSLLSAFDEAGGNGQVDLDETDLTIEDDHMRVLPSNVRRDVVLLRRMGFGISEVGERKLKGLETAEVLNLVYPKALAGRMATREDAPAPQVFEPTLSLLSIEEIKALGVICLRLEALSNAQLCQALVIEGAADGTNAGPLIVVAASTALTLVPAASRQRTMEEYLAHHPELLSFAVRDDATDEELAAILQQLVTRTCNALTMIMIRLQVCAARRELPTVDAQAILALVAPFRDLFG
ncbi:hypothetical protein BCV69DRAFT_245961 [Microstroma glucosiphilum]|uniref:Adenylate cyclase n=1 Tax=Pseudomicrostroma glucosiphilum TaxID=1684307 RepID=A0A316UB05_9BASI|nr:hypothetical protein BCV69DRAFT_245961 [Pseudomicrostroma glucosiphilum]PWN22397.1 hypothetical protein BCV69DRAFT_245961 [Pseudomicrostroma glucosiphilum]